LAQIYEGMFVLDNEVVRAGWDAAKQQVTGLIEKHGGEVKTARHWGERKLAYKINNRSRATFLLSFFTMPGDNIPAFTRDLEINETVMRYLQLQVDELPEGEEAEAAKETGGEFSVPEPPRDEVGTYTLWGDEEEESARRDGRDGRKTSSSSDDKAESKDDDAKGESKDADKAESKDDAKAESTDSTETEEKQEA